MVGGFENPLCAGRLSDDRTAADSVPVPRANDMARALSRCPARAPPVVCETLLELGLRSRFACRRLGVVATGQGKTSCDLPIIRVTK